LEYDFAPSRNSVYSTEDMASADYVRMYISSRASDSLLWLATHTCLLYDICYVCTAPAFVILYWVLCYGRRRRDRFAGQFVLCRLSV
jgi:hypothetical protein